MTTVNEKLTNLADKIRVLSGTENAMGLDAMTTHVGNANTEVATQADLISQIQTALQNKASASEPVLQSKTVTPTTSQQYVTPDNNYDGLSKVTVNAMPTATQATPSISVSSAGLITASATQSAGYVTAGTKSATKQLTTQGAKTITPSTSSQTAVASGVYTTGAITVGAIPSTYIQPSGTKTITENGTHDVANYKSVEVNVASGSSGGSNGGVNTCTIVFNSKYNDALGVFPAVLSVYNNGVVEPYILTGWSLKDVTVNNVVCGSPIVLAGISNLKSYTSTTYFSVSGDVELIEKNSSNKYITLKAPVTAGATGTIDFTCA